MNAYESFKIVTANLLETKPVTDFGVADIVIISGFSRQCFYKFFRDKYDVVNSVFLDRNSALDKVISEFEEIDVILRICCEQYREKASFYRNACLYTGQNSSIELLRDISFKKHHDAIIKARGGIPLTAEESFILRKVSTNITSSLREYLLTGCFEPIDWMVNYEIGIFPDFLYEAYKYKLE